MSFWNSLSSLIYSFFFAAIQVFVLSTSHLCSGSTWMSGNDECFFSLVGMSILCFCTTENYILDIRVGCGDGRNKGLSIKRLAEGIDCWFTADRTLKCVFCQVWAHVGNYCFYQLIHMLIVEITQNISSTAPFDVYKSVPLHLVCQVRGRNGIYLELQVQCFQSYLCIPVALKCGRHSFQHHTTRSPSSSLHASPNSMIKLPKWYITRA